MRKSVGSFVVLNRRALLLLGVVLSLTIFGVVALQSRAQSNTGNSTPDADPTPETPSVGCTFGPGWTLEAPMPAHVQSPAATSDGTYGYVVGGFDNSTFQPSNVIVRYDPITGQIVLKLPVTLAVSQASAVYAPITNKIYLFGGTDSSFGRTNITQIYDIATDFWSFGPNMPDRRGNMTSGYYNGNIYLSGGDDGNQAQTTTWRFAPLTGIFTNLSPAPSATTGAGYGMTNIGRLFVVGGNDATGTPTRAGHVYDVDSNTWFTKLNAPVAVDFAASVLVPLVVVRQGRQLLDEGTLMVIGGGNAANPFAAGRTTQIYDPAMNSWSSGPNLNVGRYAPAGFTVGGKVFVVGGFDGTTTVGTIESLTINCPVTTVVISGNIKQFGYGGPNTNMGGVTVNLNGSSTQTTTTDTNGNYSFAGLVSGGSYLVTPQGFAFDAISRSYNNLTANVTNTDFLAYTDPSGQPRNLKVPATYAMSGGLIDVPLLFTSQGNEVSMAFSLTYDTSVLNSPVVTCGSGDPGCALTVDTSITGKVGITVTPATQLAAGEKVIASIGMHYFGTPTTPTFNPSLNFGDSPTVRRISDVSNDPRASRYTNGFVIFTDVSVSGRAVTSDGRGLRNATVSMTDSNGVSRTTTTSSFGFFSFANVTAGQTYTIRVLSRLFRFPPQTVQVNNDITLPDFVGQQ